MSIVSRKHSHCDVHKISDDELKPWLKLLLETSLDSSDVKLFLGELEKRFIARETEARRTMISEFQESLTDAFKNTESLIIQSCVARTFGRLMREETDVQSHASCGEAAAVLRRLRYYRCIQIFEDSNCLLLYWELLVKIIEIDTGLLYTRSYSSCDEDDGISSTSATYYFDGEGCETLKSFSEEIIHIPDNHVEMDNESLCDVKMQPSLNSLESHSPSYPPPPEVLDMKPWNSHVSFKHIPDKQFFEPDSPIISIPRLHLMGHASEPLIAIGDRRKDMRRHMSEPAMNIKDPAQKSAKGLTLGIYQADPILFMMGGSVPVRVGLNYLGERDRIIGAIDSSPFNVNYYCDGLSLDSLGQNEAHIIVCSTHGTKEQVFLEDEDGLTYGVSAEHLAKLSPCLSMCKIMIYSWCFSQRFSEKMKGIDHVIAIDSEHKIPDVAIISFQEQFFKFLFRQESTIRAAFEAALNYVNTHDLRNQHRRVYDEYFRILPENANHDVTLKDIFQNNNEVQKEWFVHNLTALTGCGYVRKLRPSASKLTPRSPELMVSWPALQRPIYIARRVWTGYQWLFVSPQRNKFLVYHGPATLGKRTTIIQLACIAVHKNKVPGGVCLVRCDQPQSMDEFLEILVRHLQQLNLHQYLINDLEPTENSLHQFFNAIEKDFALFLIPNSGLDDWFPSDKSLLSKICSFLGRISRSNNLYLCTCATHTIWRLLPSTDLYCQISTGIPVTTQKLDEAVDFVRAEKEKIPKTLNQNMMWKIQLIDKLLESKLFSRGDHRIQYKFPRTARTLHGLVSLIVAGVPMFVIEKALLYGRSPDYGIKHALEKEKKFNLFHDVKTWMDVITVLRKTLAQHETDFA